MSVSLIFFLGLFNIISSQQGEKLVFVYEQFRHGARDPYSIISEEGDYYGRKWPTLGELTNVGMREHYITGLRNRERYREFLGPKYDPREILVRSTKKNRTIMSALSRLQGLYPEGSGPLLDEDLEDVSLPDNVTITPDIAEQLERMRGYALPHQIHVMPVYFYEDIEILIFDMCPAVGEYKARNLRDSVELHQVLNHFYNVYADRLMERMGDKIKHKERLRDLGFLYGFCDTFIADYYQGYDFKIISDIIDIEEYKGACLDIFNANYQYFLYGDKESVVGIMSMSPEFRRLLGFMENKINDDIRNITKPGYDDYSTPKYVITSGHDNTVYGMQSFLSGAFHFNDFRVVKYASSMYFEVYLNKDAENKLTKSYDDYTVYFKMNEETIRKWSFTEFRDTINENLWTQREIDDFCGFYHEEENGKKEDKKNNNNTFKILTFVFAVSTFVFVATSMTLAITLYKRKHNIAVDGKLME